MSLLKILQKYYWIISILLIIIGLVIDLFFTEAIPQIKPQTFKDLTGKSLQVDAYFFTYKYELLKILSNICYSLAISLLVLLAIELKYDEVEKEKFRILEEEERNAFKSEIKELQEQINNNIFNGVLKKLIPEELFKIIQKDIFNKKIIRKDAVWHYEIIENNIGYNVIQHISYELENITDEEVPEVLTIAISQLPQVKSYVDKIKIEKENTSPLEFNLTDLQSRLESSNNYSKSIKETITLKPRQKVKITTTIKNEYNSFSITDSHNSKYSIVGLTITVQKPADCDFGLNPTFSNPLEFNQQTSTYLSYKKIDGILIGQGVGFILNKVSSSTNSIPTRLTTLNE
jgi:hypothetical protein